MEMSKTIEPGTVTVSLRGRTRDVPCLRVGGVSLITRGRLLRTMEIHDEEWLPLRTIGNPMSYVDVLTAQPRVTHPIQPDLFTFTQRSDTGATDTVAYEYENAAMIQLSSYGNWWDALSQESRRNVRLAGKRGVSVHAVPFDAALVRGIQEIYNESPVRLGKPFWHFGKDLSAVERENRTYLDRSEFIGAYWCDRLIGFVKLVYVDKVASIMQILAMGAHQDKKTTNALIAKAVEIAVDRGMEQLKYCQYVYGRNGDSSLTEFKRRNGFTKVMFRRYFVPLTWRGDVAIRTGCHLDARRHVPQWLLSYGVDIRRMYYSRGRPLAQIRN